MTGQENTTTASFSARATTQWCSRPISARPVEEGLPRAQRDAGGGLVDARGSASPGSCTTRTPSSTARSRTCRGIADLELERRGAHYIEPELNVALLQRMATCSSGGRTSRGPSLVRSIQRQGCRATAALARRFVPVVEEIVGPESRSAADRRRRAAQIYSKSSQEGRLLLEASELSPLEFVVQEFEHPTVQAGLLFFNGLREVDLRCKGFGHHIPILLAAAGKAQMCVGGSAALARALERGGARKRRRDPLQTRAEPHPRRKRHGRSGSKRFTASSSLHARFVVVGTQPASDVSRPDGRARTCRKEWRDRAKEFTYNLMAPLFGTPPRSA